MNVACTACPAKYAVPDERVRGKRARITCKHCGTPIIVDGTTLGSGGSRETSVAKAPRNTIIGLPSVQPAVRDTGHSQVAIAPPGAWLVALADGRREPASLARIVDLYASGTINASSFVWREGMPEWRTPLEIPEIAAALASRGLGARTKELPSVAGQVIEQEEPTHVAVSPIEERDRLRRGELGTELRDAAVDEEQVTIARDTSPPSSGRPARGNVATRVRSNTRPPMGAPAGGRTRKITLPPLEPRARHSDLPPLASSPLLPRPSAPSSRPPPPSARSRQMSSPRLPLPSAVDEFAIPLTGSNARSSMAAVAIPPPPPPPAAPPAVSRPFGSAVEPFPSGLIASAPHAAVAPPAPPAPPLEAGPRSHAPVALPYDYEFEAGLRRQRSRRTVMAGVGLVLAAGMGAGIWWKVRTPDRTPPAIAAATVAPPAPTAPPITATSEPASSTAAVASASASAEPVASSPPTPAAAPVAHRAASTGRSATLAAAAVARAPRNPLDEPEAKPTVSKKSDSGSAEGSAVSDSSSGDTDSSTSSSSTADSLAFQAALSGQPFDRDAAANALGEAASNASGCKDPNGPTGSGQATVTFATSGRVTSANVNGDFAGTSVGTCVVKLFRSAKVPPFAGDPVTVSKRFSIE